SGAAVSISDSGAMARTLYSKCRGDSATRWSGKPCLRGTVSYRAARRSAVLLKTPAEPGHAPFRSKGKNAEVAGQPASFRTLRGVSHVRRRRAVAATEGAVEVAPSHRHLSPLATHSSRAAATLSTMPIYPLASHADRPMNRPSMFFLTAR